MARRHWPGAESGVSFSAMLQANPRRWGIIGLVAFALVLRLAWVLHLPVDEKRLAALPDQREYLQLGRNLLSGAGLVLHDERLNADVLAYRTPGYPAFIALCGGSIRFVRIAQAIIDSSTVLAVYLLARRWLDHQRSLLAAALIAINPWLIFFCGLLLAETLFIALLAWGMCWLMRSAGGVIALAVSVLVRPSALVLSVLLALVNPHRAKPYDWRRAGFAVVVLLIVLFPWAWRNHATLRDWIWTTTNGGITLYDGFNPAADGSSNQSFVRTMSQLKEQSEVERSRYLAQLAVQYAADHPGRLVQLTLVKWLRTWSPIPLSREYGTDWRYVVIGFLYTLPLFLLTVAGLVGDRLTPTAKMFLMLPALYSTGLVALSVGSIRYRIPADVPMAVVAAAAGGKGRVKAE